MQKMTYMGVLVALISLNLNAADMPKGAEKLMNAPAKSADKKSTFLRSHSKQIGSIGRYEVYQIKVRGLDVPNLSSAVIYDPATETILVVGTSSAPGLGGALINSAGNVGAATMFGHSLRPDRTSVSNDSASQSEGGVAISGSSSKGGNANALSNSNSSSSSSVPPGKQKSKKKSK